MSEYKFKYIIRIPVQRGTNPHTYCRTISAVISFYFFFSLFSGTKHPNSAHVKKGRPQTALCIPVNLLLFGQCVEHLSEDIVPEEIIHFSDLMLKTFLCIREIIIDNRRMHQF